MKIHTLDTRFQGMTQVTAVYLLEASSGPVLIETGPGTTLPVVLAALADHGYHPADVAHILVTHIHLDHAGAAGWWAQQGAQVYVHHVGAPHLIDPSKLLASAGRIYGDAMDRLWGETLPAPADQVTALYDGDTVRAGDLTLTALDTPGHAYHHHAYLLETETGQIAFTGDAAGVNLPQVGVTDLPAPPPEFHLETWLATLDRLEAQQLQAIYPTHYGPVSDVHGHLSALRQLMLDAVAFVAERRDAGIERDTLLADYIAWNRRRAAAQHLSAQAIERYELANPLFMSVDGILRYLKKKASA
jgi:glyoxylase-like metal-dependent hydrolase (beta-lactamase superfamily II)